MIDLAEQLLYSSNPISSSPISFSRLNSKCLCDAISTNPEFCRPSFLEHILCSLRFPSIATESPAAPPHPLRCRDGAF